MQKHKGGYLDSELITALVILWTRFVNFFKFFSQLLISEKKRSIFEKKITILLQQNTEIESEKRKRKNFTRILESFLFF